MANNQSNPSIPTNTASAITSDVRRSELPCGGQEASATAKQSNATKCIECNIVLNSLDQARSHYGGKSHQNRLRELGVTISENISLNSQKASHTSKATLCTACKLTLNSEAQAIQHYKGKSHLNRIKELELGTEGGCETGGGGVSVWSDAVPVQAGTTLTVCTTCGVTMNSVMQAKQHFEGKSHQMKCIGQGVSAAAAPIPVKVNSFRANGGGLVSARRTQEMTSFQQPRPTNSGTGSQPCPADQSLGGDESCPGGQQVQGAQPTEATSQKRKAAEVSCSVCCLVLNSETQAVLHFSSRRHLKRMKMQHKSQKQWNSVLAGETPEMTPRKNRFYCQQCHLSVNSLSQLTAHMQGQQHRSKLQMGQHPYAISTVGQPGELSGMPTNVWTEVPGNKNGWFYCRLCDISVPTAFNLHQHVQSNGHLEQKHQDYDVDCSHDNYASTSWSEEPSQCYDSCYDYPTYVHY